MERVDMFLETTGEIFVIRGINGEPGEPGHPLNSNTARTCNPSSSKQKRNTEVKMRRLVNRLKKTRFSGVKKAVASKTDRK